MATGRSTSAREVAHRHNLFVHAYGETGDATAAAISAGYAPSNAMSQGCRLLSDAKVGPRARAEREKRVQAQQDDFSRQQAALRAAADGAIATLADVAKAAPRNEEGKPDKAHHLGALARVQAAIAILDRAGHKPVERVEQRVEWADVTRELGGVDVRTILQDALADIADSPSALPDRALIGNSGA